MKVKVGVLVSPSLTVIMVSVDVSNVELELKSRVKVEVAVLGSPSLTVLMVSVDVKQFDIRLELPYETLVNLFVGYTVNGF